MSAIDKDKYTLAEEKAKQYIAGVAPDLERRLGPRSEKSQQMVHGQISRAASFTMRALGHEWMLKEDVGEKYFRSCMRLEMRRLVKSIVKKWHGDPDSVWIQFKNYCIEKAAAEAAKVAVKRIAAMK